MVMVRVCALEERPEWRFGTPRTVRVRSRDNVSIEGSIGEPRMLMESRLVGELVVHLGCRVGQC